MTFDRVVLSAANEGQARAYRAELRSRGMANRATVVSDPGGRRVGSGVSTLVALAGIAQDLRRGGKPARDLGELFAGERVLVIHGGGDSRRLPAYAAHGKLFAPLPIVSAASRPASIFDLILGDMERIRLPDAGRVVIATGDVFLDIGGHDLRADRAGVVGVAWASTPERGSRHGVYVCDAAGQVTGFLHKPVPEECLRKGALRPDGTVLVDTGVVCLDPGTVALWLFAAGVHPDGTIGPGLVSDALAGRGPHFDLYGDMLPALAHREPLWGIDWRHGVDFSASVAPSCAFLHIGSSRELLDVLTGPTAGERFAARSRARVPDDLPAGVCVHNSVLEEAPTVLGGRVVVEGSHLVRAPALPGSNIVVGVPRDATDPVELPVGIGLVCLPLGAGVDRWVALCFGERDDFKTPLERGGTFLNEPLAEFLRRSGLEAGRLWPAASPGGAERSLWTARLWTPVNAAQLLEPVRWMLRGGGAPQSWLASERLSAAEVMAGVDHAAVLDARGRVLARV